MIEGSFITGKESGRTFRIDELLHPGNSCNVYTAQGNDQRFAVKLPRGFHPDCPKILTREAYVQKVFSHPHITRVVLFDRTGDLEQGIDVPFLVTPLAEKTLQERIADSPLSIHEAVAVVEHTAEALSAVHSKGILHNDLSTGNVLGRHSQDRIIWELTDFGRATTIEEAIKEFNNRKIQYVLPYPHEGENPILAEQVDWAKNLVYPAVTGVYYPEGRPSFQSLLWSTKMTRFHEAIEEVVERAMQVNPLHRYSSMAALLDDLRMRLAGAKGIEDV